MVIFQFYIDKISESIILEIYADNYTDIDSYMYSAFDNEIIDFKEIRKKTGLIVNLFLFKKYSEVATKYLPANVVVIIWIRFLRET